MTDVIFKLSKIYLGLENKKLQFIEVYYPYAEKNLSINGYVHTHFRGLKDVKVIGDIVHFIYNTYYGLSGSGKWKDIKLSVPKKYIREMYFINVKKQTQEEINLESYRINLRENFINS